MLRGRQERGPEEVGVLGVEPPAAEPVRASDVLWASGPRS